MPDPSKYSQIDPDTRKRMAEWSDLLRQAVDAVDGIIFAEVDSQFVSESDDLATRFPDWSPHLMHQLAFDTQFMLLASSRHALAVGHLLEAGEVFVSLFPLIRAQLELGGRVTWLLANDAVYGGQPSPEGRVARNGMELLAALCRGRRSLRSSRAAKQVKAQRDEHRQTLLELFPGSNLKWRNPGDEETWCLGGQTYATLSKSVSSFTKATGIDHGHLYDGYSNFSHPSLPMLQELHRHDSSSGRGQWYLDTQPVEGMASTSGIVLCRTAVIVASYAGADCEPILEIQERIQAVEPLDESKG